MTVLCDNSFSRISFKLSMLEELFWLPSCFSRQEKSKHIHGDLERSISKFDLRSRSPRSRCWPEWVMLHISRCVLMRRTQWCHVYVYISFLSQVIAKKRFVTSDDLIWPCKGSLVKMTHLGHQDWPKILPFERIGALRCVSQKKEAIEYFPIDL